MITWQCLPFSQLNTLQLYQIMALREAVFVVEQDCPYQDADGQDLNAEHLFAYQGDDLVAYARLYTSNPLSAHIGRVVTKTSARGQGLGQTLMQQAIDQCQQQWPKATIHISAQRYLERFYQSLGFSICSEPYLEDNIPHIAMQIKANG
jgi:ElaA protein